MERRFQNSLLNRDEESFDTTLNIQSDNSIVPEERPLTSTGRRRAGFIEINPNTDHNDISAHGHTIGQGQNDGSGIPFIFFRVIQLQSNQEEEVAQGLPKEMIDKIKRMKMGKSGKDCTICYNGFKAGEKIRKLPCKHIFHDTCIMPWLEGNISCPNCRLNLFDYFIDNPEGEYS